MKTPRALLLLAGLWSVATLAAASDSDDPASPDYRDEVVDALQVIYATRQQAPAGFGRTEEAISTIVTELDLYEESKGYLPAGLSKIRSDMRILAKVCVKKAASCDFVLSDLQELKDMHKNEPGSFNILAYLNVCVDRQRSFCATNPSPATDGQDANTSAAGAAKKKSSNKGLKRLVAYMGKIGDKTHGASKTSSSGVSAPK